MSTGKVQPSQIRHPISWLFSSKRVVLSSFQQGFKLMSSRLYLGCQSRQQVKLRSYYFISQPGLLPCLPQQTFPSWGEQGEQWEWSFDIHWEVDRLEIQCTSSSLGRSRPRGSGESGASQGSWPEQGCHQWSYFACAAGAGTSGPVYWARYLVPWSKIIILLKAYEVEHPYKLLFCKLAWA